MRFPQQNSGTGLLMSFNFQDPKAIFRSTAVRKGEGFLPPDSWFSHRNYRRPGVDPFNP